MPKIIRDQALVDDNRIYLGADDSIPASGDIVVPLSRFIADTPTLLARGGQLGVRVEPGEGIAELLPHLARLSVVALSFPVFSDGRCLSYARALREQHHYAGEVLAVGDVQRDQISDMYRCGINAFALKDGESASTALTAFADFSVNYQADAREPKPIYRR